MKALILSTLLALIPLAPASVIAADKTMQAVPAEADGEVRKIDKAAKKITLKHGEIKGLDMPPMTMVFQVKDLALLDKAKVGDKVKFTVAQEGGAMIVTSIETLK
ncbi:MAG: copper-binding protein [Rhodocyclaceae bacterium]